MTEWTVDTIAQSIANGATPEAREHRAREIVADLRFVVAGDPATGRCDLCDGRAAAGVTGRIYWCCAERQEADRLGRHLIAILREMKTP